MLNRSLESIEEKYALEMPDAPAWAEKDYGKPNPDYMRRHQFETVEQKGLYYQM